MGDRGLKEAQEAITRTLRTEAEDMSAEANALEARARSLAHQRMTVEFEQLECMLKAATLRERARLMRE